MDVNRLIIVFLLTSISTYVLVFPVKKIAIKYHFLDIPTARKIHTKIIPRLGGLAIFLGVVVGLIYLKPVHPDFSAVALGGLTIVAVGLLDDRYQIRPIVKLFGQLIASTFVISGGIVINQIMLPFIGVIELGDFSVIATVIWLILITNAINLIDGLDGLAAGVSSISLITITAMAILENNFFIVALSVIIIASNVGFLFHNFYPAKIYMGDTGSLFLGYSIAVISIMGLFKNVTLVSFVVPIIVLGVPVFDTLFAILRRAVSGKKIMSPDKKHIHYQLLSAGFSHRTTVLIIYAFAALFGLIGYLFTRESRLTLFILTIIVFVILQGFAELVSVFGEKNKPLLSIVKRAKKSITNQDN